MIEIPLSNGSVNAHQRFSLRLGDNYLDFEVNYLSYLDAPAWTMNITRDGTPLITGAMLVPGADVASNYRAGIGRFMFVGAEVTLDNLGVDNHLVWVSELQTAGCGAWKLTVKHSLLRRMVLSSA